MDTKEIEAILGEHTEWFESSQEDLIHKGEFESIAGKIVKLFATPVTPVTPSGLLSNWDTAIVDLNRNNGMFKANNVRLRNCSLHYNDDCSEYYVKYGSVTYGMHDIFFRLIDMEL